MAADSTNDQELALKKRARRRLVGAIALVLLMVIVLPMVLQDRSALAPQEAIKITMPEDAAKPQSEVAVATLPTPVEPQAQTEEPVRQSAVEVPTNEPKTESLVEEPVVSTEPQEAKETVKPAEIKEKKEAKHEQKEEKPAVAKPTEKKVAEKPVEEAKKAEKAADDKPKTTGSFTIQVGVFSDPENVKQLQAKLKQVGFTSRTEKITTPKGEKIRLKAGTFPSRQEAAYALTKIQAADLTGMVISN